MLRTSIFTLPSRMNKNTIKYKHNFIVYKWKPNTSNMTQRCQKLYIYNKNTNINNYLREIVKS